MADWTFQFEPEQCKHHVSVPNRHFPSCGTYSSNKKPRHNRAVDPKNSRTALTKGDNTLPVPQLVAAQEL